MQPKCQYISWTKDFSINNIELDKQHEAIIQIANDTAYTIHKLEQNPNSLELKKELKKITMRLFHYMKTHFTDEEEFMKDIEFPLFEEHRKAHMALANQARELLNHSNDIKHFAQKLEALVNDFVIKHFAQEDILLANFLDKALHINEVHFNLEQYIMLKTLQNKDIYNEKTYDYICSCSLENIYKVPESIHEELESSNKLIKCRYCKKVLVFLKEFDIKENYQSLKERFFSIIS